MYELSGEYLDACRDAFVQDDSAKLQVAIAAAAKHGQWDDNHWARIKVAVSSTEKVELLFFTGGSAKLQCFQLVASEVFKAFNWQSIKPERQLELSAWFALSIAEFWLESKKLKVEAERNRNERFIVDAMNIYLWKDDNAVKSSQELKGFLANADKEPLNASSAIAMAELENHLLRALQLKTSGTRPRSGL